MQRDKENLAQWVKSLAQKISQDPDRHMYEKDGRVYFADPKNKYGPELMKLSDAILQEGEWGYKLSSDYVHERMLELLLAMINSPTGDEALFFIERLTEALDSYNEQRTVYLALDGIEMTDVDELRFGGVTLKKMTEAQKAELVVGLSAEEDKEKFLDRMRAVPFVEMVVSAEPVKAWELAVGRLSGVLDLLRYTMPFLSSEDFDPGINLLGLNGFSPPLVALYGDKVEYLFRSLRDLPISLQISQGAVRRMEDAGFFDAAEFAAKEDKNQLEEKVLRGIQWASDSQSQRERDNKVLSLIIALECLLPSVRRNGSASWTAEGAALLLGDNLSARKAIRNKVLGLYRKRNNIVHGGRNEEITNNDVVWLRKTVHCVIRNIIKRRCEFENPEGEYVIAAWLEDRKLVDRLS